MTIIVNVFIPNQNLGLVVNMSDQRQKTCDSHNPKVNITHQKTTLHTWRVTVEVMNPKAYSPIRGCLMMATSLKAWVFWSETQKKHDVNGMEAAYTHPVKTWGLSWTQTWGYGSTNLLGSIINMANKWHPFDKPLSKAQDRCSQPRWHEYPNQENESQGGYKSKT